MPDIAHARISGLAFVVIRPRPTTPEPFVLRSRYSLGRDSIPLLATSEIAYTTGTQSLCQLRVETMFACLKILGDRSKPNRAWFCPDKDLQPLR